MSRITQRHPARAHLGPRPDGDAARPLPRRVVLVAETYLPQVNGVTNTTRRVAAHLRASGVETVVVAPAPGPTEVDGVPVVRVPAVQLPAYPGLMIGLPVPAIEHVLREVRPDVVHVAAPAVLGAAALRAARRLGLATVAVYQTDLAGFARRYGSARAVGTLWRWIGWIHNQADLTLAPSTAAVWELRSRGVRRVARWARGVDTDAFHPRHRDDSLRRELAPHGEAIVGYVGRLAREKQLHRLAALDAIDGLRLVLVGDGPLGGELRSLLPHAHFAGLRTGLDLSRHVASLDLFVHTGVDETFCQAIQEALAAGVPVVAPASGGPLDLVQHGVNGYLWTPGSEATLTGAVRDVVGSPHRREQLAAATRASVEHRTWPCVMSELDGHYRSVLTGMAFAYAAIVP